MAELSPNVAIFLPRRFLSITGDQPIRSSVARVDFHSISFAVRFKLSVLNLKAISGVLFIPLKVRTRLKK